MKGMPVPRFTLAVGMAMTLLAAGCARQDESDGSGHAGEQQVQTLDRAQGVEQELLDAHRDRMESLEGPER